MSAVICPTITAETKSQYAQQMHKIKSFAERIHIDLMDGIFAPTQSPAIETLWWDEHIKADLHLMYRQPEKEMDKVISLKPNLCIIHYEADGNKVNMADKLRSYGIKAGLGLLPDTSADMVLPIIKHFDHALIFGGHLGYHGGTADLTQLKKVSILKDHYPMLEYSWDGGVNEDNIKSIAEAGVSLFNVGGYIHNAADPFSAYAKLKHILNA